MEEHWTRDAELLERFVRGTLTAGERRALEVHLQGCPPCRDAVENERTLAAGIRRAGRSELRARLRRRLAARPTTKTPWPLIVRAAAVIVIVAGIVVLTRWQAVVTTPAGDEPAMADLRRQDAGDSGPGDVPLREKSSPPTESDRAAAPRRTPAREVPAGPADLSTGHAPKEAPAPAGRAEPQVAVAEAEMGEEKQSVQAASAPAPASVVEQSARTASAPTPLIVVRSPHALGKAGSAEASQEIPLLAEMRNDTLVVRVLGPPPPGAGEGDLLEAELVGTDSLILRFTDLTLGLKLPRAFPAGIRLQKPH